MSAGGQLVRVALACVIAVAVSGCPPTASTPRAPEWLRAGVILSAKAVREANGACAVVAQGIAQRALAEPDAQAQIAGVQLAKNVVHTCNVAARDAADALDFAEQALDAGELGAEGYVACAGLAAVKALEPIRDLVTRHGGKVPPIVDQAIEVDRALSALAAPVCAVPATDGGTHG